MSPGFAVERVLALFVSPIAAMSMKMGPGDFERSPPTMSKVAGGDILFELFDSGVEF